MSLLKRSSVALRATSSFAAYRRQPADHKLRLCYSTTRDSVSAASNYIAILHSAIHRPLSSLLVLLLARNETRSGDGLMTVWDSSQPVGQSLTSPATDSTVHGITIIRRYSTHNGRWIVGWTDLPMVRIVACRSQQHRQLVIASDANNYRATQCITALH